MLHYGERVEKFAKAFQRRPTDYYRASNGLLVATNDRVIFIGIAPSDKLENEDAPQTILQYEFPNDTLLTLKKARLYLLTRARSAGLASRTAEPQAFAASRGDEEALDSLVDHVNRRLDAQRVEAIRERRIRAGVAAADQPADLLRREARRRDLEHRHAVRHHARDTSRSGTTSSATAFASATRLIVKAEGPRPPPPPPPGSEPHSDPCGPRSTAARPAAGTPPSRR